MEKDCPSTKEQRELVEWCSSCIEQGAGTIDNYEFNGNIDSNKQCADYLADNLADIERFMRELEAEYSAYMW